MPAIREATTTRDGPPRLLKLGRIGINIRCSRFVEAGQWSGPARRTR
jgi:hypothetical protein